MAWRVGWLVWVAFAGCGPRVLIDTDGEAGSTTDVPTTDVPSTESGDETTGVSSSEGGPGEDSGTTGVSCEVFLDAREPGTPVAIRIANVGDVPILLDAPCSNHDYLDLESAEGYTWPAGFCASTCEAQFIDGCIVCDGCAAAAYTIVNPGAYHDVQWLGEMYLEWSPPEACFVAGSCGDICWQRRVDLEHLITANVRAVSVEDCLAVEADPNVCVCEDGSAPTCETYGSTFVEPSLEATATWQPGTASPFVIEIAG